MMRHVLSNSSRYVRVSGLRHGMVMQRCALSSNSVLAFPRNHPYAFNIGLATVKTSLCDILVQKYIEKRDEIDWKRNAVFVAFGCAYLGVFQWFIYVTLFKRWFPQTAKFANQPFREKIRNKEGLKDLCKQVAFDNFVHYTFIYFPVFYVFKEAIQGTGYDKTPSSVVSTGLGTYFGQNFVEDNAKMYATWIPGDFIIYAVPMWLRLPTNHALSFLWTCYLSFLRGDANDEDEDIKEYRNLKAWLSLSTNDLLRQDAESIDRFFQKVDLDKNGKIKISELRSALEHNISISDLEGGTDVERAEIRKAIMTSLMISTLGTKLNKDAKQLIRSADLNGDGEIDLAELRDLIRRAKELKPMPLEQAEKWLTFSRRVLKHHKKSDEDIDDEIDRLFDMIDLNGDGKIEVAELQRALAHVASDDARQVIMGPDVHDIGGDAESVELRRFFLIRLLKSMRNSGINDTESLLEVADLDQDGSIDREEMRRIMSKARNAIKRQRLGASGML